MVCGPFKNCVVLGHVCDADGRKESKSKGNYTSPFLVLRGRAPLNALPEDEIIDVSSPLFYEIAELYGASAFRADRLNDV